MGSVVEPDLPDQATQPRRFLNILMIAAISLCGYSILRAALKNVREHI